MNNKLKIILPIVLVSSSALIIFQIKNNSNNKKTDISTPKSNTINSTDKITSNQIFQQLSVLPNRCRGCGKCVRIDPVHFEMQGNIAVVISSQNLDSSNLKLTINNCPAQAIVLE